MGKENTPNQNSDDNAPNETSQKFDRPESKLVRHPRVDEEDLKKTDHYVSLKEIKESDKTNGISSNNSKDKPEPTPDLEKVTPGSREV
jgi:hypothetical protein